MFLIEKIIEHNVYHNITFYGNPNFLTKKRYTEYNRRKRASDYFRNVSSFDLEEAVPKNYMYISDFFNKVDSIEDIYEDYFYVLRNSDLFSSSYLCFFNKTNKSSTIIKKLYSIKLRYQDLISQILRTPLENILVGFHLYSYIRHDGELCLHIYIGTTPEYMDKNYKKIMPFDNSFNVVKMTDIDNLNLNNISLHNKDNYDRFVSAKKIKNKDIYNESSLYNYKNYIAQYNIFAEDEDILKYINESCVLFFNVLSLILYEKTDYKLIDNDKVFKHINLPNILLEV